MNATLTRTAPTTIPSFAQTIPSLAQTFLPGVAALESGYLAQLLSFRSTEMWLFALERGVKLEHDLFMAMLGFAPEEHVAPWDTMSRANDTSWLAALDKGLAAAGE